MVGSGIRIGNAACAQHRLELVGPLGLSLVMSRRPIDLLWAGLSAIGLSLLAIPSSELDVVGLVFGAIAGLLRAGYVLLNRRSANYSTIGAAWR